MVVPRPGASSGPSVQVSIPPRRSSLPWRDKGGAHMRGDVRRAVIYPHRSVRGLHVTAARLVIAVIVAAFLSVGVYLSRERLLFEHNRISRGLVELCDLTVLGVQTVDVFGPIGSTPVVVTKVFRFGDAPVRVGILFMASVIGLLAIHRRVQLARNFVVFLLILLLVAVGVMVFSQSFEIGSAEFAQIWLRMEVLVWLLVPWFSAFLFVLLEPAVWLGILWALAVQAYAFLWSAFRLAFCLAVVHYSGLLFVPLLWFCLGLLADLVYLMVFYSLATHTAIGRSWGKRAMWQF